MEQTMEEIRKLFRDQGVTMYGAGDIGLIDHVRPGNQPRDILPGASSFLCIAMPFPKGVYSMKRNMEIAYWWNSNLYFNRIDDLMLRVCQILEEKGYSALALNGCFPLDIDRRGGFAGYVSMIHMAAALKMGSIGRNGLIFHSKYGPRLILGALVTSAPLPKVLEPGPDTAGCPEGCRVCQEKCPAKAIDENGRVDISACVHHAGESPMRFLFIALFDFLIPMLSRLHIIDAQGSLPPKLQRLANIIFANTHGMFTCINCVSLCPHLQGAETEN